VKESVLAIGLGGNEGGENAVIHRFSAVATTLREATGSEPRRSSVYRSAPHGPIQDQPTFVNAVLVFPWRPIDPVALMAAILDLETVLGRDRRRSVPMGPRPIDIDLLMAGELELEIDSPLHVVVPHPRIAERAFVLAPMAEVLGSDFVVPGQAASIRSLLDALGDQSIERTDLDW